MEPIGASVLEPIAGSAFALNLIYIGLERFRYRQQIREAAETHLKSLASNGSDDLPDSLKDLQVYKQLLSLRALPNHSGSEIAGADKASKMPSEVWGLAYEFVFRHHLDRRASLLAAVLCAFVLCVGVAEGVETWSWLRSAFDRPYSVVWFYAVILAGLVPVILASLGKWVVRRTNARAKDCLSEVEKAMSALPRKAAVRDLPEVSRPPSPVVVVAPASAASAAREELLRMEKATREMWRRQRNGEPPAGQ